MIEESEPSNSTACVLGYSEIVIVKRKIIREVDHTKRKNRLERHPFRKLLHMNEVNHLNYYNHILFIFSKKFRFPNECIKLLRNEPLNAFTFSAILRVFPSCKNF